MNRNYKVVLRFLNKDIEVVVSANSLDEAETKVLAIKPEKLLKLWFKQNPPTVNIIYTFPEPVTKL